MLSTANPALLGYVGRRPGAAVPDRQSDDWYTPAQYLDAARLALGGAIDLDPYSSEAANRTVQARHIFTARDPAPPGEQWPAVFTAWMNPPYSAGRVLPAITRFVTAFRAGRFDRGVCLVNNASETRFFQLLLREANALCLTDHRIAFEQCDGKRVSGNTRGQAFFYFTHGKCEPFASAFTPFGPVLRCGRSLVKGGR